MTTKTDRDSKPSRVESQCVKMTLSLQVEICPLYISVFKENIERVLYKNPLKKVAGEALWPIQISITNLTSSLFPKAVA